MSELAWLGFQSEYYLKIGAYGMYDYYNNLYQEMRRDKV